MGSGIEIPTAVIVAVIVGIVVIAAIMMLRPAKPPATELDAITAIANGVGGVFS